MCENNCMHFFKKWWNIQTDQKQRLLQNSLTEVENTEFT